ncbi:purine-cytosine permease family protein [Rhodococcus qingshengii]|uniref:purine-cytosine permease family protein n=1 Tax=Rhodococcus qingshengii TaxID=334542 RepID=UPI0036D8BFA8
MSDRNNNHNRETPMASAAPLFEKIGVGRIPEADRNSTPLRFLGMHLGTNLSLAMLIFGALAVEFGLGFWGAITSLTVGSLVGVVLAIPLILIGSKTATNNSTASGAHFGVRGRLVGSIVGLAINLVYTALGIWSGGQLIVAMLARLVGTPDTDAARAVAYAGLSLMVAVVAIWGYHVLFRVEIVVAILGAVSFALLAMAFFGKSDWSYDGGSYLLDSFWKTWIYSAVALGLSGPMASVIYMGDWSRYISPAKHSTRRLTVLGCAGLFTGVLLPSALGASIAVALHDPKGDFYPSLVNEAPGWALLAILPLAILGTIGFVATNVYSSGLDLDAILPRLSRAAATTAGVIVSTALVFLGSFVYNATHALTAAALVLVAISAPWVAITGLGYLWCRGRYHVDDLQVFNRRETGGRYWYSHGFNRGAMFAWAVAASYGCLAIDATPIYKGPLADVAGGVDTSFIGSFALAGIIYFCYLSTVYSRAGQKRDTTIPGDPKAELAKEGVL